MKRSIVAIIAVLFGNFCFGQTSVTIPALAGSHGDTVLIPVHIEDVTGRGVLSFEFTLEFDHGVIAFLDVAPDSTLSGHTGWTVLANTTGASVKVAGYGAEALVGGGTLVNLRWVAIGEPGAFTALSFMSILLNAGTPAAAPGNGSFQISAGVLSSPQLLSPPKNFVSPALRIILQWQPVSGATRYRIQMASDSAFSPLVLDDSSTVGTSIAVAPLKPASQYYWRVSAMNAAGPSPWSEVWQFTSSLTGVREPANEPHRFELLQNYPNPWNPSTVIRYCLAQRSPVTLTVYDALGRVVECLVNQAQEAGFHEVTLHADHQASGVYLYRLVAGGSVQVKSMVLLR